MNRKLIFESHSLPGGLIFTKVVLPYPSAVTEQQAADKIADRYGLRWKGSEPTSEPVRGLVFDTARSFDLGYLVAEVARARTISESELDAIDAALTATRRVVERERVLARQLAARPNWDSEFFGEHLPAAEWCRGPHPTGRACSECGPTLESHVLHKSVYGT